MNSFTFHRGCILACLLQCFVGTLSGEEAGDYSQVLEPFLRQHCFECHGAKKQEAKLTLHKLSGEFATDGAQIWETVRDQLRAGNMPPEDRKRPSAESLQAALAWIDAELDRASLSAEALARLYPIDGNRLEHAKLFSVRPEPGAASPPRLWRINPEIYGTTFTRVTNVKWPIPTGGPVGKVLRTKIDLSAPWGLMGDPGIKDFSSLYRIDEPETELLLDNAAAMARYILRETKTKSPVAIQYQGYANSQEKVTREEAERMVSRVFSHCLLRDPTDEERRRYGHLLFEGSDDLGRSQGLELLLTAVLARTDSVFRIELGGGKPDEFGRVMLSPRELAFAISFSLTDAVPDAELLRAANAGQLQARDDVRKQVDRLLALPLTHRPTVLRFFREYFGHPEAETVFKDTETLMKAGLGRRLNVKQLVKDTDQLISYFIEQDQDVLRQLLTTDKAFIMNTMNDAPYVRPNLDRAGVDKATPLTLPADQRAGILTQPSWLIAHSTNFDNHAIHRGKWVRERLLGGSIPATPITVDAKLPDDPHLTLREKMAVTQEAFCWKCHEKMNPLGLAFEMFDHVGQYRTMDLGKPVDTSGAVIDSGDPQLDGPVVNALELVRRLGDSPHVEQVFVRHAFRFWMGRNEQPSDAGALQDAHRAYRESGGSMNALLASLLTSDVFIYRKGS